jgi:hypothetical protein
VDAQVLRVLLRVNDDTLHHLKRVDDVKPHGPPQNLDCSWTLRWREGWATMPPLPRRERKSLRWSWKRRPGA